MLAILLCFFVLPLAVVFTAMWVTRTSAIRAEITWDEYAHNSARFSSRAYLAREFDRARTSVYRALSPRSVTRAGW